MACWIVSWNASWCIFGAQLVHQERVRWPVRVGASAPAGAARLPTLPKRVSRRLVSATDSRPTGGGAQGRTIRDAQPAEPATGVHVPVGANDNCPARSSEPR